MRYVAFLRGINVGGHHKVPMAQLRQEFAKLGFKKVITLLNSGNIIFEASDTNNIDLEEKIADHLEIIYDFTIPTIVRGEETILSLINSEPFEGEKDTKDTRFYITFLKSKNRQEVPLPWKSEDESYRILQEMEGCILSVLDVSVTKTPKAMKALEDFYGKDVTTRNWNTITKIGSKLT